MNRITQILLGTDFSPCATAARQQAARIAQWNRARLLVVHVVDRLVVEEYAEVCQRPLPEVEAEVVNLLQGKFQEWLAPLGGAAEGEVTIGLPIEVLLRQAESRRADLLVLGLRGDSTAHTDTGSLALKCLRKVPVKVLLVHEQHAGPFRTVLAGVDFSETAREAVAQALRVARQDHSRVHFVHVFRGPWRQLHFRAETPQAGPDFQVQYRRLLEQRLKAFVGATDGVEVSFEVADAGSVSQGLTDYAIRVAADLLVLGCNGRSNLKQVLLGSTAERVLREAPCSALVVRPLVSDAAA